MSQRIEITHGEAYPVAFVRFEDDERPDFDPFQPNAELDDAEASELRRVLREFFYWQARLLDMIGKQE